MWPPSWLIRIVLAWCALLVVQMALNAILPISAPGNAAHMFAWLVGAQLISVTGLGLVAARTDWRGLKLGLALAAIPLAISTVNIIEGAIFLGASGIAWPRLLAVSALTYALLVPIWGIIFSRGREVAIPNYDPFFSRSWGQRLWRLAISDMAYLVLYFTAGALIFPLVRDFYATQSVPPLGTIVALQLGLRGPVFVVVCLLLLRMTGASRARGAMIVGLVFTILSGVAPLLPPNPYFTNAVRWVHFGEVVSSNFIFGALVGWLWGPTRSR